MGYDPSEYRYVTGPDSLRGLNEIEGFYIGSYEQREDIEQIRNIISYTKGRSIGTTVGTPVMGSPISVGYK